MPGCFEDVNGVEARLFKDTEPPIFLMADGRFAMKYGGLWKVRSSIKPLLVLLNRFQAAIKLMSFQSVYEPSVTNCSGPRVVQAVSFDRGILGLKDGKREKNRWARWYEYDAKAEAEIKAIYEEEHRLDMAHAKAIRQLRDRLNRTAKRLKPVTEGNFRNIIAGIDNVRPRAKVKRGKA